MHFARQVNYAFVGGETDTKQKLMRWMQCCSYCSGCLQMILALSSSHVRLPPLAIGGGPIVEGKKIQEVKSNCLPEVIR